MVNSRVCPCVDARIRAVATAVGVPPTCFVFQAEDGIRDLVRSRGLGDVYKRQGPGRRHRQRRACRRGGDWPWLIHRRARRAGPRQGLSLIHI